MKLKLRSISSQPSWVIQNSQVELAVTRLGGHMAPVTFYRGSAAPVRPYYISPWQGEGLKIDTPVLAPLRGDFFCMPFGGGAYRGETHPAHGEPATRPWTLVSAEESGGVASLTLTMQTKVRPGEVTKRLSLVEGHNAVYCRHVLEGFSGPMPLGHHATLAMPQQQRTVHVSTSPLRYGRTCPIPPGDPAQGEYHSLAPDSRFADLSRVPTIWKDPAFDDCSSLPARQGFCDILAVFHNPAHSPAWTAATFENQGFLWFSLKDPLVLPTLTMWIENRGRHGSPWNGRNNCLGLEDVCGYFAMGLPVSARANCLNRDGVPTAVKLSPKRPTAVNYIQGVVKAPRGFGKVKTVAFAPGRATFISAAGKQATAPVRHEFLQSGQL